MNWNQISSSATIKQIRQFGILVGIVLVAVGSWQLYRQIYPIVRIVLWSIGSFLFAGGLLWPQILKPLYVLWMLLAHMLSWVNTRIILGVIFYLIFTPIALVMRILQRDGLQKKINKNASSYWTQRTAPENIKEHFERQF